MRQRKSLELYPLTMCYFIIRTQKCTKLFFNHYLVDKQRYKKFVISEIRCIFATD